MSATTTIHIDGAELTVETSALFRAWFERRLDQPGKPSFSIPAAKPGDRYLTSIMQPDGHMCHTFVMDGEDEMTWDDGIAWAKEKGGDLPNRIEQAAMLQFMPEQFQKAAYWSNTQHAGGSGSAWYQDFDYGDQNHYRKSAELRVRAVRREFTDSVI
jgi:hypothetical protein